MGLHSRAWTGIRILVVGGSPTLAMQVEQGIGGAYPGIEDQIDSFEQFPEALEFTKDNQSVGLILAIESKSGPSSLDVFRSLSTPFENSRGPCFGILLREGGETITGHAALRFSQGRLLDYLPADEFVQSDVAFSHMKDIWLKYIQATEETIAPSAIRNAISDIISPGLNKNIQNILARCINLLTSRINLSTWEAMAVRWQPKMQALQFADPTFWKTQTALIDLVKIAETTEPIKDVDSLVQSQQALPKRLSSFISLMVEALSRQELHILLDKVDEKAVPGSPGLIRQIAKHRKEIISIALSEEGQHQEKKSVV